MLHPSTEDTLSTYLIDERAAARLLGLTVSTMRSWRVSGKGPQFVKISRAVRYRIIDIQEFTSKHFKCSTRQVVKQSAGKRV